MFSCILLWRRCLGQALGEDVCGCPALHAASQVGWFGSVAHQVGVEIWLHGLNALVERLAPYDAEVIVDQRTVQAPEAVGYSKAFWRDSARET